MDFNLRARAIGWLLFNFKLRVGGESPNAVVKHNNDDGNNND